MATDIFKNILLYVKYPSVSGIIAVMWIASTVLILTDAALPTNKIMLINSVATIIIAIVGFRVDKQ